MANESMMNLDELSIKVTFWLVLAFGIAMGVESFLIKTFKRPSPEKPKPETSYLYEKDTISQIKLITMK